MESGDEGLTLRRSLLSFNYNSVGLLTSDEDDAFPPPFDLTTDSRTDNVVKMKRAAGRCDRDFIDDLKNDRIVDRELSSEMYREYVQKIVQARMEFNQKLKEAGIPNPTGAIAKVPKVPESEMVPAESEVNQWLTESETSENLLLSPSDTNEAASGLYPETVHSAL